MCVVCVLKSLPHMNLARRASSFLDTSGPQTAEQLGKWDETFVQRVLQEDVFSSVLMQNMGRGWLVSSDFSGYDAPKEGSRILVQALRKHVRNPKSIKDIRFVRACDMGEEQKQCLKMQSSLHESSASCVFSNVLDRLPEVHRDWIMEASPAKEMDLDQAREANMLVEQFVSRQGAAMFPPKAMCYCEMHRRRCPAFPGAVLEQAAQLQSAGTLQHAGETSPSCKSPSRSPFIASGPWHEDVTSLGDGAEKPIVCSVAGLVCTDWSPLGQRRGRVGSGLTQAVHTVWAAERSQLCKYQLEDWYFSENSGQYPVDQQQAQLLSGTHTVKYIITGPEMLGFPMHRPRMFSFGFDKSRWAWIGGPNEQEEFLELFGATCELPGDVYLAATQEEIISFVTLEAQRRNQALPEGFEDMDMREYLTCLLPPGCLVRLGQYEASKKDRQSVAGHFMADLNQNIGFGPASGPEVPSLNTHPCIFSWSLQRLALSQELLQAQGIDFYHSLSGGRPLSPLTEVFRAFNDHTLRMFAGNAIHVPSYTAWMMYCASRVTSRERHSRRAPAMPAADDGDGDEEAPSRKSKAARVVVDLTSAVVDLA